MKCNGKCYLVKKLKEQQTQDTSDKVPQNQKFEIQPYLLPHSVAVDYIILKEKIPFIIEDDLTLSTLPHLIFHPPTYLS